LFHQKKKKTKPTRWFKPTPTLWGVSKKIVAKQNQTTTPHFTQQSRGGGVKPHTICQVGVKNPQNKKSLVPQKKINKKNNHPILGGVTLKETTWFRGGHTPNQQTKPTQTQLCFESLQSNSTTNNNFEGSFSTKGCQKTTPIIHGGDQHCNKKWWEKILHFDQTQTDTHETGGGVWGGKQI